MANIGDKFGRWTMAEHASDRCGNAHARFVCECGSSRVINVSSVTSGRSKSCGCLMAEKVKATFTTHGETSGYKKTPEYLAWLGAKDRCYNPNNIHYDIYGGRGIAMDHVWRSDFSAFLAHVGRKPTRGHSLDRIDSNGNYAPGNVRWATPSEQANNLRCNVRLSTSETLAQAARRAGISPTGLIKRLRKGMPEQQALIPPADKSITVNGETRTMTEWSRRLGGQPTLIRARLRYGWSIERAVTQPLRPNKNSH